MQKSTTESASWQKPLYGIKINQNLPEIPLKSGVLGRPGGANLRFISHILSLLLLSAVLLLATSCEKEINIVHDQLELYYEESTSLSTLDYKDVRKFDLEVGDFVYQYPDAKKDTLYPKIQTNIHAAYTRLNIWPGDWGDQKTIEFEFGQ